MRVRMVHRIGVRRASGAPHPGKTFLSGSAVVLDAGLAAVVPRRHPAAGVAIRLAGHAAAIAGVLLADEARTLRLRLVAADGGARGLSLPRASAAVASLASGPR